MGKKSKKRTKSLTKEVNQRPSSETSKSVAADEVILSPHQASSSQASSLSSTTSAAEEIGANVETLEVTTSPFVHNPDESLAPVQSSLGASLSTSLQSNQHNQEELAEADAAIRETPEGNSKDTTSSVEEIMALSSSVPPASDHVENSHPSSGAPTRTLPSVAAPPNEPNSNAGNVHPASAEAGVPGELSLRTNTTLLDACKGVSGEVDDEDDTDRMGVACDLERCVVS